MASRTDKRKIKVVQVIADGGIGGGPQHVLGILKHLDKEYFEVFLICPKGRLFDRAEKIKGVRVFALAVGSKFDFRAWRRFNKIVERIRSGSDPFGPLIIHSHGSRAGLIARLKKKNGIKYIYTEHRFDADFHLKSRLNEWLQKRALSYLNNRTDLIIAVSAAVRSFLLKEKMARSGRLLVISNAIDKTDFVKGGGCKSRLAPIIGSIGNLNIVKGQSYLISAFGQVAREYPLATLELVGEGPERKNLESQIANLKMGRNVTLLGRVEDPSRYMKNWSVFVLPSIAETFGIVILEAFAAGVPVIASRVGGILEIIKDKKNGLLVNPRDSSAIASAIISLLKDRKKSDKLAAEGWKTLTNFSWEEVIEEIEKIYRGLFAPEILLR